MSSLTSLYCIFTLVIFSTINYLVLSSHLSPYYYDGICPEALPTIKQVVKNAVRRERRMGASLLRLHFHDCFVQGCDGSILLDETASMESEKNALPNVNSARGFEVIDRIKSQVDKVCKGSVVSCADILAVAARDSVVALGGPTWKVRLGRRDSMAANKAEANITIPSPFMSLSQLLHSFEDQGLTAKDLVVLSGAHTLGFSQCSLFRSRIHNATVADKIDRSFARRLRATCPWSGGDTNLAALDQTPVRFDTGYFDNLLLKRGLLQSDQVLFSGGETDGLVKKYSKNGYGVFWRDFGTTMIRMANIRLLVGDKGEIRTNCRKVN